MRLVFHATGVGATSIGVLFLSGCSLVCLADDGSRCGEETDGGGGQGGSTSTLSSSSGTGGDPVGGGGSGGGEPTSDLFTWVHALDSPENHQPPETIPLTVVRPNGDSLAFTAALRAPFDFDGDGPLESSGVAGEALPLVRYGRDGSVLGASWLATTTGAFVPVMGDMAVFEAATPELRRIAIAASFEITGGGSGDLTPLGIGSVYTCASDCFIGLVAVFDGDGNLVDGLRITSNTKRARPWGVAFDDNGRALVTGEFRGRLDLEKLDGTVLATVDGDLSAAMKSSHVFVTRLVEANHLLTVDWLTAFGGQAGMNLQAAGLDVASGQGWIGVGGKFSGTWKPFGVTTASCATTLAACTCTAATCTSSGGTDAFFVKLSQTGVPQSLHIFGAGGSDEIRRLTDDADAALAVGSFNAGTKALGCLSSTKSVDGFVMRLDPGAASPFTTCTGLGVSSARPNDTTRDIALRNGEIVVSGRGDSTLEMYFGKTVVATISGAGFGYAGYALALDKTTLTPTRGLTFGGLAEDSADAVALTSDGAITASGAYVSSFDVLPDPVSGGLYLGELKPLPLVTPVNQ